MKIPKILEKFKFSFENPKNFGKYPNFPMKIPKILENIQIFRLKSQKFWKKFIFSYENTKKFP